ncbi:protein kinase domain-containing protein [Clostridium felsineum]|uniref:Serine/threonine-protein kinase YbdM n=1 Tax=Clostridium felsineum TaxID=36839 RepID=A0A1S8LZQ4_9CLOT|nr:protein kinase [Clostridium felsineum]URZ09167.1 putative serine/threonine-protein kinase YbdM [Clostridium felsineum]URZ13853.1 putative serine/threonine-protein kinase YbdM [Clostridium felsineum]
MIPFLKKKIYRLGDFICGYRIVKLIGEGKFGICYLVTLNEKQYILKKIKAKAIKKSGNKVIFEEEILSSINHPLIPKIVDIIKDDKVYAYILEYKEGKTLEDMLFGCNHVFTSDEIYRIGIKLINIIKYLHERGIVHRDIRLPNVIINKDEVYLIDFGLARWINNKKYSVSVDFSYLGHLLIYLIYSSFKKNNKKSVPWYDELDLSIEERNFLKKLIGLNDEYTNIYEVEKDFLKIKT